MYIYWTFFIHTLNIFNTLWTLLSGYMLNICKMHIDTFFKCHETKLNAWFFKVLNNFISDPNIFYKLCENSVHFHEDFRKMWCTNLNCEHFLKVMNIIELNKHLYKFREHYLGIPYWTLIASGAPNRRLLASLKWTSAHCWA